MTITQITFDEVPNKFTDTYPVGGEFAVWLRDNDIYYYARPHETFSVGEAYQLAARAGRSKLLLEDLS